MTNRHPVVFLVDVDNTLLDNDRIAADLKQHLEREIGHERQERYWAIFEALRAELGYADYLGALQRYRVEHPRDPHVLTVSSFLVNYPFASRLYPDALDVLARFRGWGPTVIFSDGDAVFQPLKVERSGLQDAVGGDVLIYIHKERELDDVEQRYPAERYVLVDDKLRILTALKRAWRERVTTVFPRQGHYAHDAAALATYPPADVSVDRIGDLLAYALPGLLAPGGAGGGGRRAGRPAERVMSPSSVHPLAGRPAPPELLVNVPRLLTAYYTERPDPSVPAQRIVFGTSGHRGSSLAASFNEAHILAMTQAICLYRRAHGIDGPLFLGWDTHALSEPARVSALEVLAANGVDVMVDARDDFTPTPVVSWAILAHNRGRSTGLADGIVITPSHNPPEYGGLKYDPPSGGPADTAVTAWIQDRANALLADDLRGVIRHPWERARRAASMHRFEYLRSYVGDLAAVIAIDTIRGAKLTVGVDPLGGASIRYWEAIGEHWNIGLSVANPAVDPTFRFMPVDRDGKIRMDPSSPYAMARLLELRDRFDLAFGNDPDADRYGIVSRRAGLLDPNHYLAAAVSYLFRHRPQWTAAAGVGKTVVTSTMIDRVAARLGRRLVEVPVGFKYFVAGLLDGSLAVAGEESAGGSFLRRDGTVWATDKDGLIMGLLAAEMTARVGRDPAEQYGALVAELGEAFYERIDVPATPEQKSALERVSPSELMLHTLAGDPVQAVRTTVPGDERPIGGIKVVTEHGWFAARPSGTEAVLKVYAESFKGRDHLRRIQEEAHAIIQKAVTTQARR